MSAGGTATQMALQAAWSQSSDEQCCLAVGASALDETCGQVVASPVLEWPFPVQMSQNQVLQAFADWDLERDEVGWRSLTCVVLVVE